MDIQLFFTLRDRLPNTYFDKHLPVKLLGVSKNRTENRKTGKKPRNRNRETETENKTEKPNRKPKNQTVQFRFWFPDRPIKTEPHRMSRFVQKTEPHRTEPLYN